jgi:hypothetical protein
MADPFYNKAGHGEDAGRRLAPLRRPTISLTLPQRGLQPLRLGEVTALICDHLKAQQPENVAGLPV